MPTSRPEGIWIIDEHARTVFANDRMAEILGTSLPELQSQHSFDYVYPEDRAAAQHLFEVKKMGDSMPFRFRLRRRDGTEVLVMVQGTPRHGPHDVFRGIVGTFRVVSELE